MPNLLPPKTSVLSLSKFDRNRIILACERRTAADDPTTIFGGIELRLNRFVPEGIAVALDGVGNILGMVDFRGDHDVSRSAPPLTGTPNE